MIRPAGDGRRVPPRLNGSMSNSSTPDSVDSDATVLKVIQTLVEIKVTVRVLGLDLPAAERELQRRLAVDRLDRTIEFAREHYLIPRGIDVFM